MEDETIEYKKSLSEMKEAMISIVAILNKHRKGELFFGINSKGQVLNQNINEKTLRDISQTISNHIEPKIYPTIENNNGVIKISFSGKETPYFAYGRAYIRVADEDKKMSSKELENFILKKNKLSWENEICEKAVLDDVDDQTLKWFLKESGKDFESIKTSLKKLKLIQNNKLLNSAILLFGKQPQNYFINAKLRCAVFGTEDTNVDIDMQEFEGNLFYLIKQAENYFLKNIHIGMKLEGLKRVDVPEINFEAFREAIINAFCHRDYYNQDAVHLAIFRDRVEIRSPGLLFGDLTIERIRKEKVSERRNEIIANMFHLVNFVENWGKGISKILKLEPKTEFKELGRKFYTVFKRKTPQKPPQKTPQKLTELEQKIINLIKNDSSITRNNIAKQLNLSPETIKEYLDKLKNKEVIKRIGGRKSGYWEINPQYL